MHRSLWYSITHISRLSEKEYFGLVNRIKYVVMLMFLASAIVFFFVAFYGGFYKVLNDIASSNLYIYSLAFAAVFAGYMLRYFKWRYYLTRLGIHLPPSKNLPIYLSLYSMNLTPGKLGRVLVAYTVSRVAKKKFVRIIPAVTLDIFTDFLGFAIVALIMALYFNRYVYYILIVDIVLILPFAFVMNKRLYDRIKSFFKKHKIWERFTVYGDEYYASQSVINTPKVYLVSLALTVPAAFLAAFSLYISLIALGFGAHLASSTFIYTTSSLMGMISSSPGNIGVEEGVLIALTGTFLHASASVSSAATIMTRMATLWFGVILGGIMLFYTFRYWRKR